MPDLPLVPYVRVSRVGGRDGESFISPDEQLRKIRSAAIERGVPLLDEPFVDLDHSGGTTDRPAFGQALALIRSGKAGGLFVATSSRFARLVEALGLVEEIENLGGRVEVASGPSLSMVGANATFTTTVYAAVDQFVRQDKGEQLDDARRNSIERGIHPRPVYGYKRGAGKRLVPVEPAASEVRRAFELRAEGRSWKSIARELNATSERRWTISNVHRTIANDVYRGVAISGDLRNEEAHPAIVSAELAAKARRARGTKPVAGERSLLAGLARCAECGYSLKYQRVGERGYYRCADRASVGCSGVNVSAPMLDALADDFLVSYLAGIRIEASATDEASVAADAAVALAAERLRRFVSDNADLAYGSPAERRIFEEEKAERRAALASAEEEQRAAQNAAAGVDLPTDLSPESYRDLPTAERRHLLTGLLAMIVVRSAGRRERVADRIRVHLATPEILASNLIRFARENGPEPYAGEAAL